MVYFSLDFWVESLDFWVSGIDFWPKKVYSRSSALRSALSSTVAQISVVLILPVPECSPNKPEVASIAVEAHCEGMARGMDSEVTLDASLGEPMMEPKLYLAATEMTTTARGE
jgi:hypothetical protein